MTPVAPLITAFLREYMPVERGFSPHTCETYAHAFRLLFAFASERLKRRPSQLCLEHIDAAMLLEFLSHIEQHRGSSATTRNSRLCGGQDVHAICRVPDARGTGAGKADPGHPSQAP